MIANPNCSEAVFRLETHDENKLRLLLVQLAIDTGHRKQIPRLEEDMINVTMPACGGLGPGDLEIKIHTDEETKQRSYIIMIGNNELTDMKEAGSCGFLNLLRYMKDKGEKVFEAESDEICKKYARDCTCGIVWLGD